MDIQNTLKKLSELDLTQAEIAAEMGCSQSTVSDLVRGEIGKKRPSYAIVIAVQALAKKYRISTEPKRRKKAVA